MARLYDSIVALALTIAHTTGQSVYSGGDSSGCGKSHILNGITQPRFITSSGASRSYSVHVPSNYNPTTHYPLIVGYHGSSSIGLFLEADTRLDDAKYTGDKIVVYPNGVGGAWAGASYSKTTVAQDLQFTWDLLKDVRKNYCVDSARIYATGLSIGGGFVNTLACNDTVGGEFAAFAPASGSFYTDINGPDNGCTPARALTPILEFHGGSDTDVPYTGGPGEGGQLPAIPDWLKSWATRNGCDTPNAEEDTFNNDVHRLIWTCQGKVGAVQHYKTDSQKHDWASTTLDFSAIAAGDLPTHIDASAIIQDFFKNYTRPAQ